MPTRQFTLEHGAILPWVPTGTPPILAQPVTSVAGWSGFTSVSNGSLVHREGICQRRFCAPVTQAIHLPTLASLWETSYGKAIIVKVAILAGALLLAGVNLVWTGPRLLAATRSRPDVGPSAATLLQRD